jgi:hypothetical protein
MTERKSITREINTMNDDKELRKYYRGLPKEHRIKKQYGTFKEFYLAYERYADLLLLDRMLAEYLLEGEDM